MHINASFTFDRKRNSVEVEIKQDVAGTVRYVGPMTVRIQELDGAFNHTVQVEEKATKINLNCHSRTVVQRANIKHISNLSPFSLFLQVLSDRLKPLMILVISHCRLLIKILVKNAQIIH